MSSGDMAAGPDVSAGTRTAGDAISVIMPVYNEDRGLESTLLALIDAGHWHELVVVDASNDAQCRALLDTALSNPRLPHNTRLLRDVGQGRARQMNAGAEHASGQILLFLHADTELPTGASRLIAQALTGRKCWGRFDVRFDTDRGWLWCVARMMNLRSHLFSVVTGDQAIFVRRDAFAQAGGYDPIPLMEDIAISKRLKRQSRAHRISVPVITSGRRWQTDGPVRTILLMWTLRACYWLGVPATTLSRWYRATRRAQ